MLFISSMIIVAIILSGALAGVVMVVKFYNSPHGLDDPQNLFEVKFGFALPSSVVIVDEECHDNGRGEPVYYAKMSFHEKDLCYLRRHVTRYYYQHGLSNERMKKADYDIILVLDTDCYWWDVNPSEIKVAHKAIVAGEGRAKSKLSIAVITKDKSGQYFLYVLH